MGGQVGPVGNYWCGDNGSLEGSPQFVPEVQAEGDDIQDLLGEGVEGEVLPYRPSGQMRGARVGEGEGGQWGLLIEHVIGAAVVEGEPLVGVHECTSQNWLY